jgi:hypothetical protein
MLILSDIYISRVQDGVASVLDCWSTDHVPPPEDTTQGGTDDATVISGTEINGETTVTFKRKLDTGDTGHDVVITQGEMDCICSYL